MSKRDELLRLKKEAEERVRVAKANRDAIQEQYSAREAELAAKEDAINGQAKVISTLKAERDAAVGRLSSLEAARDTELNALDAEIAAKRQEQEQLRRNLDEAWANVKRRDEEIKRTQGQL